MVFNGIITEATPLTILEQWGRQQAEAFAGVLLCTLPRLRPVWPGPHKVTEGRSHSGPTPGKESPARECQGPAVSRTRGEQPGASVPP